MDITEEKKEQIRKRLEKMSAEELQIFINERLNKLRGDPEKKKDYMNYLLDEGCAPGELEDINELLDSDQALEIIERYYE